MKTLLFILVFFIHIQASTDEVSSLAWKISAAKAQSSGSGFFIAPNTFVTNFHVLGAFLQQAQLQDVRITQDGNTQTIGIAKIVSMSALHDLAVVQTNQSVDTDVRTITLDQSFRSQQPLVIAGYPTGHLRVLKQNEPITVNSDKSISFAVNQTSSLKGVSGGPIMNSRNEVVGIVSEMFFNMLYLPITIKQLSQVIRGIHSIGRCSNCSPQEWISQALQQLTRLANKGHKTAQYKLGMYYFEGGVIKQSTPQSKKWLRKAAKKGHLYAQNRLGQILFAEHPLMINGEGFRWLRQAAEGGVVMANFLLSQLILQFREQSFAGKDWINKHNELVERTRVQGLYISRDLPLMEPGLAICQRSFSSP